MKKEQKNKTAHQVLKMYNEGELRAPCVRLQCLEFNTDFYLELVHANQQFFKNKPRPAPPSRNFAKRRKVEDEAPKDEDAEGSVPSASSKTSASITSAEEHEVFSSLVSAGDGEPCWTVLSEGTTVIAGSDSVPTMNIPASAPPVMQTRSATRSASSRMLLTLRVPGGRMTQSSGDEMNVDELSSSDDSDDLYAA